MAVLTEYLEDFSGGEVDHISSLEFEPNQWMKLRGFVFDNDLRLRSQWSARTWIVDAEGS